MRRIIWSRSGQESVPLVDERSYTAFMRWLLAIPAILVLLFIGFIAAFDLGAFHSTIEKQVALKTGAKVRLGQLSILPTWPLTLTVQSVQLESEEGWSLDTSALRLEVTRLLPPYTFHLTCHQ